MTFATFLSFFVLVLALVYSPGPMTMFLMAQGMRKEYSSIWPIMLGANNGYLLSIIFFMIGFSTVFQENTVVLKAFQITGIVYLLYLAYAQWIKSTSREGVGFLGVTKERGALALYWRGMIIALSNPKTLILFGVIFPQFIEAGKSRISQVIILGATFLILQILSGWSYAHFGSRIKRLIDTPNFQMKVHRVSSLILVLVAFLLISKF